MKNHFLLVCWLFLKSIPLFGQLDSPYSTDTFSIPYLSMDVPERLNPEQSEKIKNFVLEKYLSYLSCINEEQYEIANLPVSKKIINCSLDSSLTKVKDLTGYQFKPIFRIKSLSLYRGYRTKPQYERGFFEVDMVKRFIRDGNQQKKISPDTFPSNTTIPEIEPFVVYYNSVTDTLRFIGGPGFLDQIPEPVHGKYIMGGFEMARLYAHTRMISIAADAGFSTYFESYNHLNPDRIGSLKLPDNKKTWCFSECHLCSNSVEDTNGKCECWLIFVTRPDESYIYDYGNGSYTVHRNVWDNVEAICFRKNIYLDKNYKEFGCSKEFPYYELRITIKNTPEKYSDNKIHVRGVTEDEMNKIKESKKVPPIIIMD